MTAGTYTVTLTAINADGSNVATKTNFISVNAAQTVTPLVPTYAITVARTATGSSVDTWLAQQNAEVATVSPTTKSPGYDILSALIGCGVIPGITLCGELTGPLFLSDPHHECSRSGDQQITVINFFSTAEFCGFLRESGFFLIQATKIQILSDEYYRNVESNTPHMQKRGRC